jgi:hypothetical protein
MAKKKKGIKRISSVPIFGVDEKGNLYYDDETASRETTLSKHFDLKNLSWKEVLVDLVDYHKVAITVKKRTKTLPIGELGLLQKNGNLNKMGYLLFTLAENQGLGAEFAQLMKTLSCSDAALKKTISRLNKKLMDLFSIFERPIYYHTSAYNTKFELSSSYLKKSSKSNFLNDPKDVKFIEYNDNKNYDK